MRGFKYDGFAVIVSESFAVEKIISIIENIKKDIDEFTNIKVKSKRNKVFSLN
jgi:hypothetical protein